MIEKSFMNEKREAVISTKETLVWRLLYFSAQMAEMLFELLILYQTANMELVA